MTNGGHHRDITHRRRRYNPTDRRCDLFQCTFDFSQSLVLKTNLGRMLIFCGGLTQDVDCM